MNERVFGVTSPCSPPWSRRSSPSAFPTGSPGQHGDDRAEAGPLHALPDGWPVYARHRAVEIERVGAAEHVAEERRELVEVDRVLADHELHLTRRVDANPVADEP